MKLTKTQLKRIIKEELKKSLKEIHGMSSGEEYSSALGAMPPGAFQGGEWSPEKLDDEAVADIASQHSQDFEKLGVNQQDLYLALSEKVPEGADEWMATQFETAAGRGKAGEDFHWYTKMDYEKNFVALISFKLGLVDIKTIESVFGRDIAYAVSRQEQL